MVLAERPAKLVFPLGRRPIRSEYDAENRLIRTVDAVGNAVMYNHDLSNRAEVVTESAIALGEGAGGLAWAVVLGD